MSGTEVCMNIAKNEKNTYFAWIFCKEFEKRLTCIHFERCFNIFMTLSLEKQAILLLVLEMNFSHYQKLTSCLFKNINKYSHLYLIIASTMGCRHHSLCSVTTSALLPFSWLTSILARALENSYMEMQPKHSFFSWKLRSPFYFRTLTTVYKMLIDIHKRVWYVNNDIAN